MKSMKHLLRLVGALALTTGTATSVVACDDTNSVPALDGKYAALLAWYASDGTTSQIAQKLKYDATAKTYSVNADVTADIIAKTKFNISLLEADGSDFKAKSSDAAAFLKELGYKSGSETAKYSTDDVTAITALKANVKSSDPGTISASTSDFKVEAGTCQVEIKNGDTIVHTYKINTMKSDTLLVPAEASTIIAAKGDLKLTATEGFQVGQPVANFQLKLNDADKQKQWDALLKVLSVTTPLPLEWLKNDGITPLTPDFINGDIPKLTIKFGTVVVIVKLVLIQPVVA